MEPEQEELLVSLVEASRGLPRDERIFKLWRLGHGDVLVGPGIGQGGQREVLASDLQRLAYLGLLTITDRGKRGSFFFFYVAAAGFEHYKQLKTRADEPARQVEDDVRSLLSGARFRSIYGAAYARWSEAVDLLWGADSERELTTIGFKLRESMQAFATELVARHKPTDVTDDPEMTLDRVLAVLRTQRPLLGETRGDLLDALFHYWRASVKLVQRQTHGARRDGEPLSWEDVRRALLSTAVVMVELARVLDEPAGAQQNVA